VGEVSGQTRSIYFEDDVLAAAERISDEDERSLSKFVNMAVKKHIESMEKETDNDEET
jgi:hypothetical protein